MNHIQVLDCTLRDGCYVNDSRFGFDLMTNVTHALTQTGVEIAEIGFVRDEPYQTGRAIFNEQLNEQAAQIIGQKSPHMHYATFIEIGANYPLEKLPRCAPHSFDMIRYSYWKRCMDEGYDYLMRIKEKGYLICCQPTRVEQYTVDEFADMCRRFSKLEPYAFYIVDTFGLLRKDALVEYAKAAHEALAPNVILGYHPHNNMGQAFCNACAFLENDYGERTVQIDSSIGGMGRGAGNLHTEILLDYLNKCHGGNYQLEPILRVWDQYLQKAQQEHPWGYNMRYLLTAMNECHPDYATYFTQLDMTTTQTLRAISLIQGEDRYLYSKAKAEKFSKLALDGGKEMGL